MIQINDYNELEYDLKSRKQAREQVFIIIKEFYKEGILTHENIGYIIGELIKNDKRTKETTKAN